jgi:hypothetical protein
MQRQIVVLIVCLISLVSAPLWGAEYAPFLKKGVDRSGMDTFNELYTLPETAPQRIAFLLATQKLIKRDGVAAKQLIDNGQYRVVPIGERRIRVAGLKGSDVVFFRWAKPEELVVEAVVGDSFVPWYLLDCGNPVLQDGLGKVPEKQTPSQTTANVSRPCGVWQSPTRLVESSTVVKSWKSFHEFKGHYTPTKIITDNDYKKLEGESK